MIDRLVPAPLAAPTRDHDVINPRGLLVNAYLDSL